MSLAGESALQANCEGFETLAIHIQEISSVGSERLPYKQKVQCSIHWFPTKKKKEMLVTRKIKQFVFTRKRRKQ